MAVVNLGREGSTPPHVRAHDNPSPTVGGMEMTLGAALGDPKPRPVKGRPGLSGLAPVAPAPGIGDFGKPGKRPSRAAALRS